MSYAFWDAVKNRHSIYSLSNEEIVSRSRIRQLVADTLNYVPSSFNSQSARIVVLFGSEHRALWGITLDALKKVTPPEQFSSTEAKVKTCFASGYGTILFFEDTAVVDSLSAGFPLYADKFPVWAQHSNAMHQFALWTALEAEGLGASLQHYHPLIDDAVRARFRIPEAWSFVAQMPFGKPLEKGEQKERQSLDSRMKVFE
ncbi:MAG TPA: nitroreductase family protein [Feifaniaceae bacterium]|nr:nitroreductase family protein [Feifaniaceae bacterium]